MSKEEMSNEEAAKAIITLSDVLFGLLLMVPAAILRGYVLSVIWVWFIVPFGVTPISIAHACGLSLMIGMFTNRSSSDKNNERSLVVSLCGGAILTLFAWGVAYIIHLFM